MASNKDVPEATALGGICPGAPGLTVGFHPHKSTRPPWIHHNMADQRAYVCDVCRTLFVPVQRCTALTQDGAPCELEKGHSGLHAHSSTVSR